MNDLLTDLRELREEVRAARRITGENHKRFVDADDSENANKSLGYMNALDGFGNDLDALIAKHGEKQ